MVLLGDEAQVEALVRLEILLILTQDRCMICAERTIGLDAVLHATDENSLVMWVMSNLVSVHLQIVLVSVQDRCTVCATRTIGLEIILDASDGSPR
jgi:uncharacterized protein with PIN domain